jgi:hypothetical protein
VKVSGSTLMATVRFSFRLPAFVDRPHAAPSEDAGDLVLRQHALQSSGKGGSQAGDEGWVEDMREGCRLLNGDSKRKRCAQQERADGERSQPVVALNDALHLHPFPATHISWIGLAFRIVKITEGSSDIPEAVARILLRVKGQHLIAREMGEQFSEIPEVLFAPAGGQRVPAIPIHDSVS